MTRAEATKIAKQLYVRSFTCDRHVIAIQPDGMAVIALVGPNSLMLSQLFFDGAMITDHHLN